MGQKKESAPWEDFQQSKSDSAPWEDFQSQDHVGIKDEPMGAAQTFAESAADVPTLGYLPNIKAAAMKLGETFGMTPPTPYAERRDDYRTQLQEGQAEHPVASGLGTATGVGATMFANPGGAAAKAATSPLGRAAIESLMNLAVMGFQNPGDEQGKVSGPQLEQRAEMLKKPLSEDIPVLDQIPTGALAAVPFAGPALVRGANTLTAKAFGPTAKEVGKSIGQGGLITENNLGGYATKSGISKAMSSAGDLYDRTSAKVSQVGQKIGEFVKENGQKIENWLYSNAGDPGQSFLENSFHLENSKPRIFSTIDPFDAKKPQVINEVNNYFDNTLKPALGETHNPNFEQLQKIRTNVQSEINYERANPNKVPGKEQAYSAILDEVDRAMNHELDMVSKIPGLDSSKLDSLRKEYALGKTLEKRALRQVSKSEAQPMSFNFPMAAVSGAAGMAMSPDPKIAGVLGLLGGAAGGQIKAGPKMYSTLGALGNGQASRITSMPAIMSTMRGKESGPQMEGFPVNRLQPLDQNFKEDERARIKGDDTIAPSIKARQLQLLEKGYIYLP